MCKVKITKAVCYPVRIQASLQSLWFPVGRERRTYCQLRQLALRQRKY
jgi:hypothetical protein